jgi:hypothetical protein
VRPMPRQKRASDQLSEAELLSKHYTCDDPENVEGLSADPPPDEELRLNILTI